MTRTIKEGNENKQSYNSLMNRRKFLLRLPFAGMVFPLSAQFALQALVVGSHSVQLQNEFFLITFDPASGRLDIMRRDGNRLVSGAITRANTAQGLRATSQSAYRHTVEILPLHDRLGAAQQLVVRSVDSEHQLDIELRVALYEGRSAVLVEGICRNVSPQPITLQSLEPICAIGSEGGALYWPQTTKILTNGPMYYDPGEVADFALPEVDARRSWWNIALFRGYKKEGLVCGSVENQTALGQIVARRGEGDKIGLIMESVLAKGFELLPGMEVRSNRFMLNISPDPYTALEDYANIMGTLQTARVHSVLNGWCNWFFTYEHVTEDEIIRNAEFAARVLKPFGLQYIQVDEGFQRWHGEWEGNTRFPHGMKWLADRIRDLGLKPGIWIAPYVISEPTEVFQKHKDWLLRHPDGSLKRVGPWPSEDSDWARNENLKRYGLDITHPGAAEWLANLFDTVANRWGYEMIKIDFVDWSLLSAHRYYDATVSRAAAYRKGFQIIRQAIGPNCHLQDCGPGPVTVGLLDSMRIELDQNYGYPPNTWKQYFLNSASSAPAAAKRYYFHKRTWINDADHVCLNLLPLSQAQAAATLIALTGGNLLSGDRLPDLDSSRLEILKKILPSFGEAARPVDLFDTDRHSVFALRIRKSFGEWTVVGIFNSNESETLERVLPLDRLWLDTKKTYLAFDFWKEQFGGDVKNELHVQIPPASVVLLALHEKRDCPQVISTDRHVLQGALELESVRWDADIQTMTGVSLGPVNTEHNVAVYIPESRPWVQGGSFLFHDFPGYTLKMMDDHILRVHVRFDHDERVVWKIRFKEFFE